LDDWVLALGDQVTLLSGDVLGDEERAVLDPELPAGALEGSLGVLVLLVADEACSVPLEVHGGRVDGSELLEEVVELGISEGLGEVLNEEIGVVLADVLPLVLLDVREHIELAAAVLAAVELGDGALCAVRCLELDVAEASALS